MADAEPDEVPPDPVAEPVEVTPAPVAEPVEVTLEPAEVVEVDLETRGRGGRRRVRIHEYRCDVDAPRAVVVIVHGSGEHGMRYAPLARDLATAGCSVVTFDNLGHGRTGLDGDGLSVLGPGGSTAARACVVAMLEHTRRRLPGVPVVLYGNSWGSLLVQQALAKRPELVDAVMLSGTALAMPGFTNNGDLDAQWRPDDSGRQWLSRDEAVREAFATDPLCFDIREHPIWNTLSSLRLVHVPPSRLSAKLDDVPVLILAGSEDPVGFGTRGSAALARVYRRRSGLSDVTHRVFDGARHEVVNEINRDEVVGVMTDWIRARFPAPAQPRTHHGEGSGE